MIVDYFPFFAPYGVEVLKLRYEVLKDHVDYFVISESNKTHSGLDTERRLPEIVKELGLDEDKIIYVLCEIPEDDELEIQEIDVLNTYENYQWSSNSEKIDCQRARVRERLQKDALLLALDEFEDDTVFIHSDLDEIIKPDVIPYLAKVCRENQDIILKVPLIYCEARADLRVCYRDSNDPVDWSGGMFIATKSQLKKVTPTQIRSNNQNPFPINYIFEDGKRCEDLGWHFSWMGDQDKKRIKSQSWTHYNDNFSWTDFESFSSDSFRDFVKRHEFKEGSVPPSGRRDFKLKKISFDILPKELFEHDMLKNYFLPDDGQENSDLYERTLEKGINLINNNYDKRVWVVENFYKNPDEVRNYALTREFEEGGLGRGYIGRRTPKQYLFPGLKEAFEDIMGKKITKWEEYGMNGRFQSCWAGEPLVYHCDSQKYAGMLYLTPDAPFETGTTMYAHKSNRVRHNSHPDIMQCFHGNNLDRTHYQAVDVIGNVYNRLVIFDAGMLHAASEYFGYKLENSRLWQMFFFDAE